ncbi:hypothetical protein Lesp02_31780 [Lentzea sp. NBRC 105346]|nr:hypothetical protein Lesp02_31780 [Lentzea sp. NBRC 105346]
MIGLVAGVSMLGMVSPSSAATGFDRCPAGYACLFTGSNGTGKMAYFRVGSSDLRLQGVDNNVWSIRNRSGKCFHGYSDPNYRGDHLFGWPGNLSDGTNSTTYTATRLSSVKVGC